MLTAFAAPDSVTTVGPISIMTSASMDFLVFRSRIAALSMTNDFCRLTLGTWGDGSHFVGPAGTPLWGVPSGPAGFGVGAAAASDMAMPPAAGLQNEAPRGPARPREAPRSAAPPARGPRAPERASGRLL